MEVIVYPSVLESIFRQASVGPQITMLDALYLPLPNNNFDKDKIEKHKTRVFLCKKLSGQ